MVHFILSFLGVCVAFLIFFLVKRHLLQLRYTLFWFTIAFIILLLGLFPSLNIKLTQFLGIEYPPVFPITVAILLLFIKTLQQDIAITHKEKIIHRLVQELAILKEEINRLNNKLVNNKSSVKNELENKK